MIATTRIGISLHACIPDIVYGEFSDDVFLITKICCPSRSDFEDLLEKYRIEHWGLAGEIDYNKFVDKALVLWDAGKIIQPRLYHNDCMPSQSEDFWFEDISDVVYSHNPPRRFLRDLSYRLGNGSVLRNFQAAWREVLMDFAYSLGLSVEITYQGQTERGILGTSKNQRGFFYLYRGYCQVLIGKTCFVQKARIIVF